MRTPRLIVVAGLAMMAIYLPGSAWADTPAGVIDFNKQIRPILSDNCFQCHGPDEQERKAKLRLDTRQGAFAALRKGGFALVAGKPGESKLLERVATDDATERMPPARTNKKLKPQQIELLRQWIAQGAPYAEHWAFTAPRRPALPAVKWTDWPRNGVDRFILARLEKEGLKPSPEADPVTLIRRLTLDLTGLPPTPAEAAEFIFDCGLSLADLKSQSKIENQKSKIDKAYIKLVDRLLDSAHYGERMAVDWLDAARFADTHGYHIDSGRDMTRWREWVIDAFNSNMPFDRFTIEQLAGDLLPNATVAQKIASGFNRNHMINFEGGAIPEEYHNAYIVDRVNTTATVWLGLTMMCAQCHDHKYDPISQNEFYQLYAYFNNVPEKGLDGAKGNAAPVLAAPTKEQQRRLSEYDRILKSLESKQPADDKTKAEIAATRQAKATLEKSVATAMVMQEMPTPRETFVRIRGEYNKKGDKVLAGTPAFLPPLPKGAAVNRLGLARWLVMPEQPLTSRVIVNRYWQMIFGTGIVKSVEDFGSQSDAPSHPELLDWLAVEFQQPTASGSGAKQPWSVKDFVRMLVTSATYRQSSVVTKEHLAKDPENRLYARGPRFRLQAEFIRDQALAVSGLLNREIGGRSVSPYQPEGLWKELTERTDSKNWTAQFFVLSKGKDLYRRTMYTFWKRTSPPPQLVTFDAPDRETCTVRRGRTNTPLQALILMNDPTYVEASRKLAERLLREAKTTDERITLAFRLATARTPSERELSVLRGVFERQLQRYRADPQAAAKLLAVGQAPRDERLDAAEVAAWAIVANVVLNLDETVTKN